MKFESFSISPTLVEGCGQDEVGEFDFEGNVDNFKVYFVK